MRLPARFVTLAALSLLGTAAGPAAARDGKRIFVSVDMEGIAGVVSGDQLGPQSFEYAAFRELMTQEANAAIAAAREAGATQFVVADSHGNFENLLYIPLSFACWMSPVIGIVYAYLGWFSPKASAAEKQRWHDMNEAIQIIVPTSGASLRPGFATS